jgi:hypothetical protein
MSKVTLDIKPARAWFFQPDGFSLGLPASGFPPRASRLGLPASGFPPRTSRLGRPGCQHTSATTRIVQVAYSCQNQHPLKPARAWFFQPDGFSLGRRPSRAPLGLPSPTTHLGPLRALRAFLDTWTSRTGACLRSSSRLRAPDATPAANCHPPWRPPDMNISCSCPDNCRWRFFALFVLSLTPGRQGQVRAFAPLRASVLQTPLPPQLSPTVAPARHEHCPDNSHNLARRSG